MTVTIGDMQSARSLPDFIQKTVNDWLGSPKYAKIKEARLYYSGENPVLKRRWNRIALDTGGVIDLRPRQNIYSNFFGRMTKQFAGRLLYHDVAFDDDATLLKMGTSFQRSIRQIARDAYICSLSWGFWQRDNIVHIPADSFIPIVDDTTAEMLAGVYFWQLDENRPWNYQLFEVDGVTTWGQAKQGGKLEEKTGKTPYRYKEFKWRNGHRAITGIENYAELPIKPMYANPDKTTELSLPIKTKINAYDLLNTFYADEFLQSKFIYWLISGYSGDAEELIKIRDTARKLGIIAGGEDSSQITPQTLEPPYNAHEKIMQSLEREIFRDAMLFSPEDLAGSSSIATAIKAGQYPEDIKAKDFEHEIEQFVRGVMQVAGVESRAVTFTHFRLLDEESITRRLVMLFNMGVPIEEIIKYEPLLQDRQKEIADAIARQGLGYMEGGNELN